MSITVHNLKNGSTVSYQLPLIVGEVKQQWEHSTVEVTGEKDGKPIAWPVYSGHFKALVNLKIVYIKCIDDDGQFQGPDDQDCSVQSAQRRISLGAKLLQTFTAEKLNEHGFGYKTFTLESELYDAVPECHVFTSKLTVVEAHAMDSNQLWLYFAKELMSSKQFALKNRCKWLVYLSFTRYQIRNGIIPKTHSQVLESTKGHTALGGGGLAVYGTGTLHCWPESLDQVYKCLTDTRKIDRTIFMDDSAYREFYWANYSTGLGASLHELGHTFDLAHTPTGIMARGFDDIYRVFLVHQPNTNSHISTDNNQRASPVPYSPRQSPLHQQRVINGNCDLQPSCPSSCLHDPKSVHCGVTVKLVQTEAAFRRLRGPSKHIFIQNNYDGSQVQKSVTRYPDGTELVTQITSNTDGEQIIQEHLQHTASGKSRNTLSMSAWCSEHSKNRGKTVSSQSVTKDKSNPSWQHNSNLKFQELRCRDGGAHWYRSSAVLLKYHKWFNASSSHYLGKMPYIEGCVVQAEAGIRLIELRNQPAGVVFHHWEFLQDNPPTHFILKASQICQLSEDITFIGLLVEDDAGNIFKKKLYLEELELEESRHIP